MPGGGIEPPTRGFSIHCSTPELPGHGRRAGRLGERVLGEPDGGGKRIFVGGRAPVCPGFRGVGSVAGGPCRLVCEWVCSQGSRGRGHRRGRPSPRRISTNVPRVGLSRQTLPPRTIPEGPAARRPSRDASLLRLAQATQTGPDTSDLQSFSRKPEALRLSRNATTSTSCSSNSKQTRFRFISNRYDRPRHLPRASPYAIASSTRAQLRMPLWKLSTSYFSLGEWIRSSSRPNPISIESMPRIFLK